MRIVSRKTLREFAEVHADADEALDVWYRIVSQCEWNSFGDIREVFNSADYIGNDRYVFNIRGNKYRLVAMIFFNPKIVYIRFVGTHAAYDKIDCTTI